MKSETRTSLEQFDNPHDFERMCADILQGMGYQDVVLIAPRGGSDGGQDITFITRRGGAGVACVTLRSDIDEKFFEDMAKQSPDTVEEYIYFCRAYLTAKQKVKFTKYVIEMLHATLLLQDIEALRSLLDTALTSIRERYLGIKDEKTEIFTSLLASMQENMRKESQAQFLLNKAHETSDFWQAEALVRQAVELLPSCKRAEYRQLGIRSARIVLYGIPLEYQDSYGRMLRVYTKKGLVPYETCALRYLEETERGAEQPDAEGLLYLACLYGYQRRLRNMMQIIDQALAVDTRIEEEFCQPRILEALLLPCGSNRFDIERLRQKLHLPDPTKDLFCGFLQDIDVQQYHGYAEWVAVKQANKPGEKGVHILKICPPYTQNNGLVSAHAQVYETPTGCATS